MSKLLMISGYGATNLDAKGAFYNTLEELHKHWERIDIICPKGASRLTPHASSFFGNVFIHESPWPILFQPFWILKKGKEIFQQIHFNIMTVHEYPPFYNGIGARLLWRTIKVPYVVEIHHIPGFPKAANVKEKIYKNAMRWFVKYDTSAAKAVRVVNKGEALEFLKKSGVPEGKMKYIPSIYIDLQVFRPLSLPKEYDLIFVGRFVENKGVYLFIDAVRSLRVRAVIVGDGPLKRDVEQKVKSNNPKIDVYGWARDSREIAELINKSKVLVMPSLNEGGPRVIVEAMACGVPVIATPVGIVLDLIKSGESGEIIGWDKDSIAMKADKILKDPSLYTTYSRTGIELAQQFERGRAVKNYADALKVLMV